MEGVKGLIIMSETLVQSVMDRYKVSRQMAEELSRQIESHQRAQGLEGHYHEIGKTLGERYASRSLAENYYEVNRPTKHKAEKHL